MNNLIKQLAEQAEGTKKHVPAVWQFYDHELEHFAQMIAAHCAEVCMEMAAKCAGLPGDGALARDCAHWILQDFGVEP